MSRLPCFVRRSTLGSHRYSRHARTALRRPHLHNTDRCSAPRKRRAPRGQSHASRWPRRRHKRRPRGVSGLR
eukprot:scaffold295645_cov27-Tisochrysis_lutea.AAC.2